MKKQTVFLALLIFFLTGSVTFAFGQTDGPFNGDDGPQVQATLPVLDFQLILPLIFRPDPSTFVGPYGGSVVVILPDPHDANVVYAGSYGAGVYKSYDGGITWQPARIGLGNLWINSMAIDPQNGQVLYAGTYKDGVYKSTNGGQSWVKSSGGIQSSAVVYTIAVDPQTPSRVYIGTRGENTTGAPPWKGVLYKSEDAGASWHAVLQNIAGSGQQDWIYSLAVLPGSPNVVLAAAHEHGPFRSTDYGQTWSAYCPDLSNMDSCSVDGSGRAALFDPRSNSVALYGVWHRSGIYKSTDAARSWYSSSSGVGDAKIYSMSIDPSDPNQVYASTFIASSGDVGGVLHSINNGNSWSSAGLKGNSVYTVVVNPGNSNRLYAGIYTVGIFRSDDRGGGWSPSENGMSNVPATAVLAQPGAPNTIYTAAPNVLKTSDAGSNWAQVGSGSPSSVNALVMDPSNANVIFALTQSSGLYRIDQSGGGSWSKLVELPAAPALQSDPRPYPPVDELHMLMPDEPQEAEPAAVPGGALYAMAFAHSNPSVAYLGSGGNGVYRSTDGGLNWSSAGLSGQTVTSLVVDSSNPDLVYAATTVSGTVKYSTNHGQSWNNLALPSGVTPYVLAVSSAAPGEVYVGTTNGVYKSSNQGAWRQAGLAGQSITALAAHPTRAGVLFAGTKAGAYLSGDDGLSWADGPDALSMLGIESITIEPESGNYVYYATSASGVYMQYFR